MSGGQHWYAPAMRVLVVHHGRLPSPGQPASGGAIRAWHLGRGLQAAGLEVHWLARDQDQPGGFASPADLVRRAMAIAPDAVVCVQLEDAPALAVLDRPLAVDLYAPRLLEAPFEGAMAAVGPQVLRALAAGDSFLVSSARQRWTWLGVLALAGVDVRRDPTLLVPIASVEGPRRRWPRQPLLVAGGGAWPWADPSDALARVLARLDARGTGRVRWYGPAEHLPEHPRLETPGTVPWQELVHACAGATAAIDWMADNPEREVALGFRHADYLAAGLPVLTGAHTAVAELMGQAAWTGPIEPVLDAVLDDHEAGGAELRRRSKAARALGLSRSAEACAAPLAAWLAEPVPHGRATGPLVHAADLAAQAATAVARATHAEAAQARAETEAISKRAEVAELSARIQQLLGTVDRLSRAIDEVAGFKREAISVLGGRSEQAATELDAANQRISSLQADVEKKTAELHAADDMRGRLEDDLERARAELERLRSKGWLKR